MSRLEVSAHFVEQERYRKTHAPLLRAAHSFLKMMPVVKDTRRGRGTRRQIKTSLVVVGLVLLLGGSEYTALIPVGIVLMASAIWLPLWELDARTALASLKRNAFGSREVQVPGQLVHDGRRLELWREGKKLRRVLTDRAFRLESFQAPEGGTLWCVRPAKGEAKRDAIWFHVPEGSAANKADPERVHEVVYAQGADALLERLSV